MSEISDAIQTKCLAFGDRIIKLNDYLLEQAASRKSEGRHPQRQNSYIFRLTSYITSSRSPSIGGSLSQPTIEVGKV